MACREGGGLREPEEPACWHPGARVGHDLHRFPLCKLSCLIIGDQVSPPRSTFPLDIRWSLPCCSLCVGIGEIPSHICYLHRDILPLRYLCYDPRTEASSGNLLRATAERELPSFSADLRVSKILTTDFVQAGTRVSTQIKTHHPKRLSHLSMAFQLLCFTGIASFYRLSYPLKQQSSIT